MIKSIQLPPGSEDELLRRRADAAIAAAMKRFSGEKKTVPKTEPTVNVGVNKIKKEKKQLTFEERRLALLQTYLDADQPLTKVQKKEYDELKKKVKQD